VGVIVEKENANSPTTVEATRWPSLRLVLWLPNGV
jgi:hypothetical protein